MILSNFPFDSGLRLSLLYLPNPLNYPYNYSSLTTKFMKSTETRTNKSSLLINLRIYFRTCTISCMPGFTFPDNSSITNMNCKEGSWVPTRTDWLSISDCTPVCSPPCQNGGLCLPLNACQCPQDFRGEQCQYHENRCNTRGLGFNGDPQCHESPYSYSCTLHCPEGQELSFPPAAEYTCKYETGVFEPQPVPQCQPIPPNNIPEDQLLRKFSESEIPAFDQEASPEKPENYEMAQQLENTIPDVDTIFPDSEEPPKPSPKTCFTWGGSHYKTFDGSIYSFSSSCPYTLLQETRDAIFTIIIQNSPGCQNSGPCHKIIKIFLEGKEFLLTLNDLAVPTFRTLKKILPIPAQLPGIRVQMSADFVMLFLDSVGASLKWDGRLLLQVKASESLWNRTAGLCGRMNGDVRDDRTGKETNHHKTISGFTSDWKAQNVGEICDDDHNPEHSCGNDLVRRGEAEKFCDELFSDPKFRDCSRVMDLGSLKAACIWDFCRCRNGSQNSCACDSMSVYVRQCFHDGITKSSVWRNEETCPMSCTGGKVYKSCGPKFVPSCNDDAAAKGTDSQDCEEGCFCPEGTVLHEGNCISVEECPCRLRGKVFKPGVTIPKQCNTCTCSAGKWICTQVGCGARCATVGDPHYVTFDGKRYDFMGKCGYYLVKGEDYSIETENVACSGAISEVIIRNLSIFHATNIISSSRQWAFRVKTPPTSPPALNQSPSASLIQPSPSTRTAG